MQAIVVRPLPSNAEARILDRLWTDLRRQQAATRAGERFGRGVRADGVDQQTNACPE